MLEHAVSLRLPPVLNSFELNFSFEFFRVLLPVSQRFLSFPKLSQFSSIALCVLHVILALMHSFFRRSSLKTLFCTCKQWTRLHACHNQVAAILSNSVRMYVWTGHAPANKLRLPITMRKEMHRFPISIGMGLCSAALRAAEALLLSRVIKLISQGSPADYHSIKATFTHLETWVG